MKYLDLFAELHRPLPDIAPAGAVRLRPYQREAVTATYREWDAGRRSTLVCLPTGGGKSVVFSEVMRQFDGGRILVLAHRSELIYQAVAHAKRASLTVGVEMGFERAGREDVIVSSIQTQTAWSKCSGCRSEGCDQCSGKGKVRRLTKFNPRDFGLVIVDEGHHATAASYRLVLEWYRQNPAIRELLVTATPKRADGIGLHNVVDSVAYEMSLLDAISDGWLCCPKQRFITVEGLDLSSVGTKAGGDLADGELQRAFLGGSPEEETRLINAIVSPTLEEAAGRATLVFATGVEHAEKLTAGFNAFGARAEMVVGTTDKDERARIVKRYQDGETQVLVGVGCFTEGFDAPNTAVVSVVRPTKSESLYLQMIGRGTRTAPGTLDALSEATAAERLSAIASSFKPHATILDFVGNSGRHKLVSLVDVLAGDDVAPIDLEAALTAAKKSGETIDVQAALEAAKAARLEKEAKLLAEKLRREEAAARHKAERLAYKAQDVDLFSGAGFRFLEHYTPGPDGATEAQVKNLVRLGVDPKTAMSYSKRQASAVIGKMTSGGHGADFVIPFGKHTGKKLSEVPSGYVDWMAENINRPNIQREIKAFRNPHVPSRETEEAPF